MKKLLFLALFSLLMNASMNGQLYFPPIGSNTWDTLSPERFGWCQASIDALYELLESNNTNP